MSRVRVTKSGPYGEGVARHTLATPESRAP
jgi:hypothetical protein